MSATDSGKSSVVTASRERAHPPTDRSVQSPPVRSRRPASEPGNGPDPCTHSPSAHVLVGDAAPLRRLHDVQDDLPRLIAPLEELLEVDLTSLSDVGSKEVTVLLHIQQYCRDRGVTVRLISPHARVIQRLQRLGIVAVIPSGAPVARSMGRAI